MLRERRREPWRGISATSPHHESNYQGDYELSSALEPSQVWLVIVRAFLAQDLQIFGTALYGDTIRFECDLGGTWRLVLSDATSPGNLLCFRCPGSIRTEKKFLVPHFDSGEDFCGHQCGHSAGVGEVLARGNLYHMVADKTLGPVASPPNHSYRFFLLWTFVLLARPQDIFTPLQGMRPALVMTLLATGIMVFGGRSKEIWAALSTREAKRYLFFYLIMILGIPFAYHRKTAFEGVFETYFVNMIFFIVFVAQVTSTRISRTAR